MIYASLMVMAAFMASCSQILLKFSTMDEHRTALSVYLNPKVILAYFIFGLTMLINVYAFTGIEYKFGSILSSTAYFFTMLLSAVFLKEKMTWRCVSGNLLIIAGIVIYTLNSTH